MKRNLITIKPRDIKMDDTLVTGTTIIGFFRFGKGGMIFLGHRNGVERTVRLDGRRNIQVWRDA